MGEVGPDTTDDVFLGGALRMLQPRSGYRAGLDAVLLAAAVPAAAGRGERVLDAGAGVGVAGACVARRVGDARVVLVERDAALAGLARANVLRNGLSDRVHVIEADLVRPLQDCPELGALAESLDHVLVNPPYHAHGRGTLAEDSRKAAAHAMPEGELDRWLRFMAAMTRPGGTVTLIHRADALAEVLEAMSGRFGALLVLPVHPRRRAAANRVLVQGIKGSRAPLALRPGITLHTADGSFQAPIEAVLRHGAALDLAGNRD